MYTLNYIQNINNQLKKNRRGEPLSYTQIGNDALSTSIIV